jgi:two-component system, OmpR family, phosphate regulon response regulator PhoB
MTTDVLVVEDERDIRNLVVLHLERDGFQCRTATNGTEALQQVKRVAPDLVVLDLMLPGLDGLEVCRRLRADPTTASVAIIILTAKADEVDRVVGLEMGADDYVVKPFSPKELLARVRAVLRRARAQPLERRLAAGPIIVDLARHRVEIAGEPVLLAPREFALLQTLLESPGRVLSRRQLLAKAWGYERADEIESRTVDVHVRRLRAKLGDEGRRIVTVKGVGYQLDAD